ncbi:hypothetical protein K353_02568 [Kitasatospora sp. SolWspMP-SS2h]|uniref:hypothetical protein n=1 Tax=Kitasatospora sp. SolWspMP-SS2h TaxID=1305729 RepID=UPI000DB9DF2E|nr:hypothetical protein [Kitasatospora sp. SolWspMP-SS2h]RAJ42219.1 hypothetical protein K353_02568 [Kitasatospora sp. SolWspMP-SS2h]
MGAIVFNVTTAALMVMMLNCGLAVLGRDTLRGRPLPWAAIALTATAVAGVLLQLTWSGAMDALDADPAKSGWWRELTSVFMQNGGLFGGLWNLLTLAAVAALAQWYWGGPLTLVLFLAGVLLPGRVDALLGLGDGPGTDPRNFAGSSGATYFLGATLALALLTRTRLPKEIALAAGVPVLGLAMWLAQDNGHGLVSAYGFALAAATWAVRHRLRPARPTAVPPGPHQP